ncbi:MAG: TonB-dependent receptor plug domain-containing protein, partial [Novosphingobium sp.]|nr:TonB-dependent receptor plug domain-containing protein [Novosphingobium sp.]
MMIAGSKRLAMRLVGMGALLSTTSLWTAVAHAAAPAASEETSTNEIVVTASRREQSLVEVPSAVSAVSGDVLQKRGLTDIRDFAALVPGFSLDDRGGTDVRLILRGQNTGGAGASVATMM